MLLRMKAHFLDLRQKILRCRQQSDEAGKLAHTLERELDALWTSVVEEGLEAMNNRAERALRFAVI
jgi:hypothetical protein